MKRAMNARNEAIYRILAAAPVVPVLTIEDRAQAVPLAGVLLLTAFGLGLFDPKTKSVDVQRWPAVPTALKTTARAVLDCR